MSFLYGMLQSGWILTQGSSAEHTHTVLQEEGPFVGEVHVQSEINSFVLTLSARGVRPSTKSLQSAPSEMPLLASSGQAKAPETA